MSNALTVPANGSAGIKASEGFGERSISRVAETASIAVAEQAKASVQARFVMAERKPRDMDDVRVRLLKDCGRLGFAEVARYAKPVGGQTIRGPSVRFVEAALRQMGNVLLETPTIYDDHEKRIVRVIATDLETNATYQKDIVIEKTVERRKAKDGQDVLGSRTNASGQTVYIVRATEDDLLNKEAALVSKAVRNLGLRLIPGDIVEESMSKCIDTMERGDRDNPDLARKKLSDAFAGLGVMPSDLKAYLGHDLGQSSPAELQDLRAIFSAVRDGETTWQAVVESKSGAQGEAPKAAATKTEGLRERLANRRTKPQASTPDVAEADSPPPDDVPLGREPGVD